jgi:hypothetical protein
MLDGVRFLTHLGRCRLPCALLVILLILACVYYRSFNQTYWDLVVAGMNGRFPLETSHDC